MAKIEVRHSSIYINDYEMGDCKKLERIFSLYDKVTHSYYIKGLIYDEEDKILIVPRGIDIHLLENYFGVPPTIINKHDHMDKISDVQIKYTPRDDVQLEALRFMVGKDKYRGNHNKSQLSLNLNTGKGKSYCSITTSAIFKLRTMIITSSIDWLNQWKNYILEYTDIKSQEIYMLVGSPSIIKLLNTDISKYKYILASHSTLTSYASTYGWKAVTELFKYTKIGIKIYDEAHLNFDNMMYIDGYTNTYKTYYVTATPARSDKDENIIFKYYFKNVPAIDLFDDNDDPRTDYISIHYNSRPTAIDIDNCNNAYGFNKTSYANYVTSKSKNFYMLLRIIMDMAINNGQKNVFYIATNKGIKIVYNWIMDNYPELSNDIGIYTSIIKKDKKKQLDKRIILSTTSSLGAAVDIKGLKMVVVLAEPFKSKVIARQSLGRTRDKNTLYVEVIDTGFLRVKKYYSIKRPTYRTYALSMSAIQLSDEELYKRSNIIINKRKRLLEYFYRSDLNLFSPFIIYDKNNLYSPFDIK